ncbi:hypothetical protein BpHYR1_054104 [Brachionus plicatilis]|uniref:Uncharacterized protein n=1 Tax=Brachionus plicatilis TaxID=10195 RepID=A0A3M7SMU1_BRAPC|nr:hypothetical protein BpHYR1_054104 [Brachionus plicatilis]
MRINMLTEKQYQKALNTRGLSYFVRKSTPALLITIVAGLYTKHCDIHERERMKLFYNKSKLFGNAKNPQY